MKLAVSAMNECYQYSANQFLELILPNSKFSQEAFAMQKKYDMDEEQFFNYLAVVIFEAVGNQYPSQQAIDKVESIISDFYGGRTSLIENNSPN